MTRTLLALPLALAVSAVSAVAAAPARACDMATVLDLVGRLEGPSGHDAVPDGVRVAPPRPVSEMTVGEVLDWQREALRGGSPSTAAGRYQLARPVLARLVEQGAVGLSDRFDARAQDRLAARLLREAGYDGRRGGEETPPETANAIARIWAALPRVGGEAGSAWEGVAGNHALISSGSWLDVLACRMTVNEALSEAALVRAGERFGFAWDRFMEEVVAGIQRVMGDAARLAAGIALFLFAMDLAWRGGRWAIGASGAAFAEGLAYRLAVVLLCLGVLAFPDALVAAVDRVARGAAGELFPGGGFSLSDHAASRAALAVSLFEGLSLQPAPLRAFIAAAAVVSAAALGFQVAVILYWQLRLVFAGIAGLPALGFGGLSRTTGVAARWARTLVASGLALLASLLVAGAFLDIAWNLRASASAPTAALGLVLLEVLATALLWLLPSRLAAIAKG